MKDIKDLIYAAVEENIVKFQQLTNDILHARAYDAIEALRPEVSASMFGEAKEMEDEDEEDEEDEDEEDEEMDDKKKSMKEALHPNQQKIDVVDDEKIDAKDFAKLRAMKKAKMKEDVELDESVFSDKAQANAVVKKLKTKHNDGNYHVVSNKDRHRVAHAYYDDSTVKKQISRLQEEAEQIDEISAKTLGSYIKRASKDQVHHRGWAASYALSDDDDAISNMDYHSKKEIKRGEGVRKATDKLVKKVQEEVDQIDEVAMPRNQADWQALITHQIKTAGHPVATDAQFRATHGKDMTKMASLEPGEDKMSYAAAQGGEVKR